MINEIEIPDWVMEFVINLFKHGLPWHAALGLAVGMSMMLASYHMEDD